MSNKDSIIKFIRGILVTSKDPLTLRHLDNDYRTMMGEKIPYYKFGFKSLTDFLSSADSLRVFDANGDTFVQAVTLPESAHIVEMKSREKPAKRKPMRSIRFSTRPIVHSNWRPKPYTSKNNKNYQTSRRPAAISHNQFVDYQKPSVASKIVIPENSSFASNIPPRFQKQNAQNSIKSRLQLDRQEASGFARKVLQDFNHNNQNGMQKAKEENAIVSSRRKAITRMMSEVTLKESETSTNNDIPTLPTLTPTNNIEVKDIGDLRLDLKVNFDFKEVGDPKIDLKNLVKYHNLGLVEVSINKVNSKRFKTFICKLRVGQHIFNSYPEEFQSESEAELYCYKEAFKVLSSQYGKRKSLLIASDTDILERIPKILEPHSRGLWEWQVQMDYSEKYHEQLPEDWLKIIDSSPCIHVQKVINTYTLKFCKPEDICISSNTIKFGEDGKLYAEVQFVLSAGEIWCQQIDTDENSKFVNMITQMEEFYNTHKNNLHATNINKNGCYAAQYGEGWYRIRALEVTETDVTCFYIDIGDEITLSKENIYKLRKEFATCPAQAFVCRLAGLEEFYEVGVESTALQQALTYKQVILELAPEVTEDETDVSISVYIYDETGKSINKELISSLAIESASPNLSEEITEVYISHIAANGDVYVQIHSKGYHRLRQLLEDLDAQIIDNPPTQILEPITKESSEDRIYLNKCNIEGHWFRVKIIDWAPNAELAQMYYIDYGHTEIIKISDAELYPLDKLSDVLSLYPAQAVRTRMLLEEIPKDFVQVTNKIMPKGETVIIKIIEYSDGTPIADFFTRNTDGSLFCINKSITIEKEIKRIDSRIIKRSISNADGAKVVTFISKLKSPTLPEVNECFQVRIPFAVNPHKFFVQPLESQRKLHKMMEQLQARYHTVEYSPLTIDQILPGNVYASKFEDDVWYRTIVIKVIKDVSISVLYCDYGYYANLTVQQLIPLDVEFFELPYQALNARLSGIKPAHSNWMSEHCEQFKQMVERKCFYSVILKMEKNELHHSDVLLELLLIDTSSSEDIYVSKELVSKGIAAEV